MLGDISKICCFAGAAALLVAGGCAHDVARREAAATPASSDIGQGGAWEAVLPSPEVAERLAYFDPHEAPEYGRADGRLNRRADDVLLASQQWPQPDRPSLLFRRTITVRDRDGQITYFDSARRWWREGYGGWVGGRGSWDGR